MEKTVRLVFRGELLPGRSLDEVKAGLPVLMKVPPEQVEKLFAGGSVVIKRGLPVSKLAAYQTLLEKAGIRVAVEDEIPEYTLDLEPVVAPEPAGPDVAVAAQESAGGEELTCPQCGARQPKRTLCRSCGVDMPRYAAAQATLKAEAMQPVPVVQGGYAASAAWMPEDELPPVLGFSFDGRLNRLRYLIYSLAGYVVLTLAGLILMGSAFNSVIHGGFPLLSLLLFGAVILALLYFGLRFSVQRLHDMGLTGWLVLLSFAPVVGWLVWLWLSIWPGSKEANQYGPPNPPNSLVHKTIVLGLVLLLVLLLGVMFSKMVNGFPGGMMRYEQHMQTLPLQDSDDQAQRQQL
ncbi:MAG: rane protein [Proteobacteria bacterium]|nr:rane protein [Pseudomonadota bacterium]